MNNSVNLSSLDVTDVEARPVNETAPPPVDLTHRRFVLEQLLKGNQSKLLGRFLGGRQDHKPMMLPIFLVYVGPSSVGDNPAELIANFLPEFWTISWPETSFPRSQNAHGVGLYSTTLVSQRTIEIAMLDSPLAALKGNDYVPSYEDVLSVMSATISQSVANFHLTFVVPVLHYQSGEPPEISELSRLLEGHGIRPCRVMLLTENVDGDNLELLQRMSSAVRQVGANIQVRTVTPLNNLSSGKDELTKNLALSLLTTLHKEGIVQMHEIQEPEEGAEASSKPSPSEPEAAPVASEIPNANDPETGVRSDVSPGLRSV